MDKRELRRRYEKNKFDPTLGFVPLEIRSARYRERLQKEKEERELNNRREQYSHDPYPTVRIQLSTSSLEMLLLLGIGVGIYFFYDYFLFILNNYASYDQPYKFVAWFYNYTIAFPLQSFPPVWNWLSSLMLTSSSIINLIISSIEIFFYGMFLLTFEMILLSLTPLMMGKFTEQDINYDDDSMFSNTMGFFLLPAVIGFFWFIISSIFGLIMDFI